MASEISRVFKDISLSFSRNPLTNDIIALQNENAIKKSVMNLVRTQVGERFFRPLIGTSLDESLFKLNNYDTTTSLSDEIRDLLQNFEPRIRVEEVRAQSEDDSYEVNITIVYTIIGLPLPAQNLDFILQPSRL